MLNISEFELALFHNYVMDFHGPDSDLYPIKGVDLEVVEKATNLLLVSCESDIPECAHIEWGGGDTADRERVRDIIIDYLEWEKGRVDPRQKVIFED